MSDAPRVLTVKETGGGTRAIRVVWAAVLPLRLSLAAACLLSSPSCWPLLATGLYLGAVPGPGCGQQVSNFQNSQD